MEVLTLALLIIPVLTAALIWAAPDKRLLKVINAAGSTMLLLCTLLLAWRMGASGNNSFAFFRGLLYIDSFSIYIIIVTILIGFLLSLYSISYIFEEAKNENYNSRKIKLYFSLYHIFILTMLLTAVTQNIGLMWIAIEATTLASTFLVGFHNSKKSIEAAWKYIIICSVGIAFAMFGIILLYYSSIQTFGKSMQAMNWQFLYEHADELQGSVLKIAFIFIILGFGTKVGLAPMHTWLPDAHSQAPSPVSALLSGVLLNTAMYAIVRVMTIVNINLGNRIFTGRLLMLLGIVSIITAALFVIVQNDYKRLLAYSSIEHMGIIAIGFGMFTPISIFGSLFHIINHAFTKSLLFTASGNVYLRYGTRNVKLVKGILSKMPVTGVAYLLGLFAITGMPPFSIFTSELYIITQLFEGRHFVIIALFLASLALIFAGFITQMTQMFYSNTDGESIEKGERPGSYIVLVIMLAVITIMGFYLPGPLKNIMLSAAEIITGGM